MKRIALVFALATSLLCGSISFAAVKSGSACTKQGATSIVSGKKYTCIKSGKKLIWDKGVAIKVTTPTPSPIPTQETVIPESPKPIEVKPGDFCNTADQGASKNTSAGNLICKKDADEDNAREPEECGE